jgi:hypothetical protein
MTVRGREIVSRPLRHPREDYNMTTQTLTTERLAEIASVLDDDKPYTLDDGRIVRLRVEPDYDSDLNDYDYLGKYAPVEPDRYYYVYPHAPRPASFDGRARIIRLRDVNVWWQPPTDYEKCDRSVRDSIYRTACDVLEYGYTVYIVEVCEGLDGYGRPIVRDFTALGGIEPLLYGKDRESVIVDVLAMLDL